MKVIPKNKEICERCFGTYATGKEYGDYWCELREVDKEPKGLCEFCNPKSVWFNKDNGLRK